MVKVPKNGKYELTGALQRGESGIFRMVTLELMYETVEGIDLSKISEVILKDKFGNAVVFDHPLWIEDIEKYRNLEGYTVTKVERRGDYI